MHRQSYRDNQTIRFYAAVSGGPSVPEIKINENVSLQKSPNKPLESSGKRPLVLLLSWLAAKQRHLNKFARFYLDQGCDVLTIKVKPLQVLLPETGSQVVAETVVDFIQKEEQRDKPILVHGFSVGGYVYSEILQRMISAQKENEITDRIIGQIYDSLVDMDNIPSGMSKALLKSNLMQTGFRKSLELYLRMTHSFVGQHHQRGSRLFRHNPVKVPTLFFYSDADPISMPSDNRRVIATLKEKVGNPAVQGKEFKSSSHVNHMYTYREEYVDTLKSFLNQLDYFKMIAAVDGIAISDSPSKDDSSIESDSVTEKTESSV